MANYEFKEEDCRHYIGLLQENINRMAANSANCKTWLLGIISALIAFEIAYKEMSFIFLGAIIPILLFYFLDSFYLGLEKRFIELENDFIDKLKSGSEDEIKENIYVLNPQKNSQKNPQKKGSDCEYTCRGMKSYSTWPFYGALLILLIALYIIFK